MSMTRKIAELSATNELAFIENINAQLHCLGSSVIHPLPRREPGDGTHADEVLGPHPADVGERLGQRRLDVEREVRHHQRQHARDAEVGEETDEQTRQDTDGNRFLWVLHLLP